MVSLTTAVTFGRYPPFLCASVSPPTIISSTILGLFESLHHIPTHSSILDPGLSPQRGGAVDAEARQSFPEGWDLEEAGRQQCFAAEGLLDAAPQVDGGGRAEVHCVIAAGRRGRGRRRVGGRAVEAPAASSLEEEVGARSGQGSPGKEQAAGVWET